ncbi:MAG: hypothetical protein FWF59_12135 [Turicibacter sp.]|nr:hypothetical protein [Turicibacter sp.]
MASKRTVMAYDYAPNKMVRILSSSWDVSTANDDVRFWLCVTFNDYVVFRKNVGWDTQKLLDFYERVIEDKPVTMLEIWDIHDKIYKNDALLMN